MANVNKEGVLFDTPSLLFLVWGIFRQEVQRLGVAAVSLKSMPAFCVVKDPFQLLKFGFTRNLNFHLWQT